MDNPFKQRLKEARKNSNLTQAQLAQKLEVSKTMVSEYESNTSSKAPSLNTLIKICRILNVSSDYLLGLSNDNTIIQMELRGLSDEQSQPLIQIMSMIEQLNELKEKEDNNN